MEAGEVFGARLRRGLQGVAVGSAVGAADGSGVSSGPRGRRHAGVSLAAGASVSALSALFTETARTGNEHDEREREQTENDQRRNGYPSREGRCCMAYLPCYSVKWMWLLM